MFCPRCTSAIPPDALQCVPCGFSLADLQQRLGSNAAVMDPVMDVAGCLRLADKSRLAALVDDFEHRFPQLHLSVFLGVLPEMKVLEAGFWLLNHGVRRRGEKVCDNRMGIVALIDPSAHEAGISVGYSLEGILPQDLLANLLRKNSHHLWHGDHYAALRGIITSLDAALRKLGKPQPRGIPWRPAGSFLGLRREAKAASNETSQQMKS